MFPGNLFFDTVIAWLNQTIWAGVKWSDVIVTAGVVYLTVIIASNITGNKSTEDD